MEQSPGTKTYAAFTGAVLIGGANFIAVSFSNMELPPFFGAALRFALATIVFGMILGLRNLPLARGRSALGAALYGVLGFGLSYACLYYALVGLAAGTTAVILATVPLFTLVIAALLGQERFSLRGVVAGLLTVAGIGVLSLDALGGELAASYLLAAVLGAITAAGSTVVARAYRHVHPASMNAVGMASGTLLLAVGSLLFGERWVLPSTTSTWVAVSWLVIAGSVGLFLLFLYVIKSWTASATVYAVSAMPVVAVALGALLLDQPITLEVVAGGALVIAAVYLGAISRRRAPAPSAEPVS